MNDPRTITKVTVQRVDLPRKPKRYIAEVDFGNGDHSVAFGRSKHEALIALMEYLLGSGRFEA
jgi:hypothetical protein